MSKELTELQEAVAGWWVHFRLAEDEEGCRRALNGAINTVLNEAIEAVKCHIEPCCEDNVVNAIKLLKQLTDSEQEL